jgi:hypothetical protein
MIIAGSSMAWNVSVQRQVDHGQVPYGFATDPTDRTLVATEDEIIIVQEIFHPSTRRRLGTPGHRRPPQQARPTASVRPPEGRQAGRRSSTVVKTLMAVLLCASTFAPRRPHPGPGARLRWTRPMPTPWLSSPHISVSFDPTPEASPSWRSVPAHARRLAGRLRQTRSTRPTPSRSPNGVAVNALRRYPAVGQR